VSASGSSAVSSAVKERETLIASASRVKLVDHVQKAKLGAHLGRVVLEIERPDMVRVLGVSGVSALEAPARRRFFGFAGTRSPSLRQTL
jgi:hypothetical protein